MYAGGDRRGPWRDLHPQFGDDPATGSPPSITGPSQVTRREHRPITALPSGPTDIKLDYLAAHSRTVDQLYEKLMRWTVSLRTGFDRCFNGGQMLSVSSRS
jgi:hypothetical protein